MRSELFEEAWKQNRHVWESTKCLAQAMYFAGEKHQQSKVDELQKRVEAAMRYSAELLADRHMDDVLLARAILYRAVHGRPAPRPRQGNVTLIQSAIESWEWAHKGR